MPEFKEGDILAVPRDREYHVFKILRIDAPVGDNKEMTYHILIYNPSVPLPVMKDIPQLGVHILHVPVASIEEDAAVVGNEPVAPKELQGFQEYLRQTDFNRYAKETRQDPEAMVQEAKGYLKIAGDLCRQALFSQAIDLYNKAIDLIPLFWEAIDNRGMAYMDMGNYKAAIQDFEQSLRIEPDNPTALFSMGESYLYLGELDKAEKIFADCVERWPKETLFQKFLAETRRRLKNF